MGRVAGIFATAAIVSAIVADGTTSAADARRVFKESKAEGGELRYVQGIPVLLLEGEPEQMGRQQAALVFDVARRNANLPKTILGEYGGGLLWPLVVGCGRSLLKDGPERCQRELNAAFTAAGCKQEEIDSLTVANSLIELRCFGLCSAFLVEPERSASGGILFGRNFDIPSYGSLDRMLLVVICRPARRHAFASVSWPGFIGVLSGMNDAGLAIACLDSGKAKDGSPGFRFGTPLSLTFRRILEECSSVEEAQKVLAASTRTTWMNLAVCDQGRALVLEITPENVVARGAEDHLLACTNHFRTPELSLWKDCWRYRILHSYWNKREPFRWRDVAAAMHRVNLGTDTTQSMIFEPKALRLRLAIGKPPASAGPFVPLELATLLERKPVSEAR